MGSVWAAEHLTLKLPVVVKFVSTELALSDELAVARFTREATAAARIKSPYVVQTLDHGVMADGTPYIVMEKLDGESLAERLDRTGPLTLAETQQVVSQVAKALSRAHQLGIVHRDIKPDNIFLVTSDDDELYAKVLDFGVAKFTNEPADARVTASGAMVGTPGYMSPEQALVGKDIDHRTDLWSLAVVTYHALVGDIPFSGETLGALCVAIAQEPIRALSEQRTELPTTLDEWMARALCRDTAGRFQSAKQLAEAFDAAIAKSKSAPSQPQLVIKPAEPQTHESYADSSPVDEPDPQRAGIGRNRATVIVLAALGLGIGIMAAAAFMHFSKPNVRPGRTGSSEPTASAPLRLSNGTSVAPEATPHAMADEPVADYDGGVESDAASSVSTGRGKHRTYGKATALGTARRTGGSGPAATQSASVTTAANTTTSPRATTTASPTVTSLPTDKDRGF